MECKITKITHSGTKGERGQDRTDGRYPMRIGRTVELDLDNVKLGKPMIINYLKNADGSDYSNMCLRTSSVVLIISTARAVFIETMNSIFTFEKTEFLGCP